VGQTQEVTPLKRVSKQHEIKQPAGGDDAHCERLTQGSKRRVWHTLYKEPLVRSLPFISTKKPPNASKNGRSGWSRRAKFSIFRNKKKPH
jgi:hypothetical protein